MCLSSLETEAISKCTPSPIIKVLHVDDDAAFLETSKLCLEIQGHFEIKVALSPHDAMEKLKQEEFDVVISDYQMPGKNGLEFLIDLRASGNNVPFILFTGKVREEVAVKALNLGAFRYVDKRGDPETVYSELSTGIHQSFEQRQAREQLKESEEWFKAIHDQQQTGIVIMNPVTHRIVNVNAAAEEMIGASREQLIGKECHDCFCPSERGKCPVTDLGQTVNKSCRVLVRMDPEGTRLPILKAVKWANIGGKDYLIESFVDISEQKRAEAALSESEEKFRATFESCKEAIVIVDDAWNLCYTNQAAQKVFGCTKEETGKFFLEKCLKDAPTEFLQSVNEASKDCKGFTEALMGKTLETTLLKASGEEIHVEVSLSAFMQKGRCHIVGFIRDITERKEQEKALLESQQKFMALFSENPEAVAFCDKDSHVLDINPGFTRLFGYSSQEAKGKDLFNLVPPPAEIGDSGFVTHKLQRGHVEGSTIIKKKDGSEAYVSLSGAPVIVNGSIIGHVTVYRDITDLVHANEELSRLFEAQSLMLNKASLLTEKLSVTGSLTRHDVRNKLSAITGYTYLAKKRLVGNDEVRTFLFQIEEVTKNIIRILDFAKTYEMLGNQERASVNVGKTVWDAASLFADLKGVTVINECEGFEVQADSLLMELFHNMIDNSLKYGEKITQIRVYTQKNPDGSTNLIYEDDGVGIEPAVKAKLFQKGFGKGTGYGLYLIKRICEMYEWTIIENGELGKGVKFTLKLPTPV